MTINNKSPASTSLCVPVLGDLVSLEMYHFSTLLLSTFRSSLALLFPSISPFYSIPYLDLIWTIRSDNSSSNNSNANCNQSSICMKNIVISIIIVVAVVFIILISSSFSSLSLCLSSKLSPGGDSSTTCQLTSPFSYCFCL